VSSPCKLGLIGVHLRSSAAIFISWGDRAMAVKAFLPQKTPAASAEQKTTVQDFDHANYL
jgi:hypothetical protein